MSRRIIDGAKEARAAAKGGTCVFEARTADGRIPSAAAPPEMLTGWCIVHGRPAAQCQSIVKPQEPSTE